VVEEVLSLDTGTVRQLAEARSPANLGPVLLFLGALAIGRFSGRLGG